MFEFPEMRIRMKTEEIGKLVSPDPVAKPYDAIRLLQKELDAMDREYVVVINLDPAMRPICWNTAAVGTSATAIVSPANVFKAAILANASGIMVLHNHPSGDITPSPEDDLLTASLGDAGRLLNIPLSDSVIVGAGNDRYFSYAESRPACLLGVDAGYTLNKALSDMEKQR